MKQYRHTRSARLFNRIVTRLIRWGVPLGPMALLTVPGRKTGIPRSTPIAIAPHANGWRLIAPYGAVHWVRNLRAAGWGTLTVRGSAHKVLAAEVPVDEAGPLLRQALTGAGFFVRRRLMPYFNATTTDGDDAWAKEAFTHPVFILSETTPSDI